MEIEGQERKNFTVSSNFKRPLRESLARLAISGTGIVGGMGLFLGGVMEANLTENGIGVGILGLAALVEMFVYPHH